MDGCVFAMGVLVAIFGSLAAEIFRRLDRRDLALLSVGLVVFVFFVCWILLPATQIAAPRDRPRFERPREPPPTEPVPTPPRAPDNDCIPRSRCCAVCSTGQACGNACISRSKTCHKASGCACEEWEVCG